MLSYSETIDVDGIAIPYDPQIITPRIERPMRNSRYERGAREHLGDVLQESDRLLDLGAGTGAVSVFAARIIGGDAVLAVEPNPKMIPLIEEVLRLNDAEGVTLIPAAVGAQAMRAPLFQRADFWSSSMVAGERAFVASTEVEVLALSDLIVRHAPTVIYCDIEGAEASLFERVDLSAVRHVIVDTHDKLYGDVGLETLIATMERQGFDRDLSRRASSLMRFDRVRKARPQPTPQPITDPAARRAVFDHVPSPVGPDHARILIPTCMKDEGPFILEWLAWHIAAGVTDFVVFTNDISDGSDALLDHLDRRGIVMHLLNPAVVAESTYFQPIALGYAAELRVFKDADYVISMDVDEFVNVHTGAGTLHDLFAAVEPFDALSIYELNHGANDHEVYERGWLKDLFPAHQSAGPGRHRSRRGVKTITRNSDRLAKVRNHRPDLSEEAPGKVWLDGSGRRIDHFLENPGENGGDCRGGYDLVSLNHFAIRSVESYLIKMFRGDVVKAGKQVSPRYWRMRNDNSSTSVGFDRLNAAARKVHADLFESDDALMALHEACCRSHEQRIAHLRQLPEYQARIDWIKANSWTEPDEG